MAPRRRASAADRPSFPTERCVACGRVDEVGRVVPHATREWVHRTEDCYRAYAAGQRAGEPSDLF